MSAKKHNEACEDKLFLQPCVCCFVCVSPVAQIACRRVYLPHMGNTGTSTLRRCNLPPAVRAVQVHVSQPVLRCLCGGCYGRRGWERTDSSLLSERLHAALCEYVKHRSECRRRRATWGARAISFLECLNRELQLFLFGRCKRKETGL